MALKNELNELYKLTLTAIQISLQAGRTSDLSGLISIAKDLIYELESLPNENSGETNFIVDDKYSTKGKIKELEELEDLEEVFKKIFSKVK